MAWIRPTTRKSTHVYTFEQRISSLMQCWKMRKMPVAACDIIIAEVCAVVHTVSSLWFLLFLLQLFVAVEGNWRLCLDGVARATRSVLTSTGSYFILVVL